MLKLLADVDSEGQFKAIVLICQSGEWADVWRELGAQVLSFEALGIPRNLSDRELWELCQAQELVLFTGNRNQEHDDSLEAVIRARNSINCLPVLTVSLPKRVLKDRIYAERVAEKLLDTLLDIETVRGDGRIYLP